MGRIDSVTKTTKHGLKVHFHSPDESDAQEVLDYAMSVFKTAKYVLTEPDEFTVTLEREKEIMREHLENPLQVMIIAKVESRVVGMVNFVPGRRRKISHQGEFGMSVHADFRDQGVGKLLLEELLNWVKLQPQLESVRLKVFEQNQLAFALYQKCGFEVESKELRAVKYNDGTYDNSIGMVHHVRSN